MIVRMTKPEAIRLPAVRALFLKALEHGALAPEVSIERVAANCRNPNVAVLIGLEDKLPKSLLVIVFPHDPRTDRPLLDLGVNTGSAALKKEIWEAGMAFIKGAGYNQAWCFNHSGRSDAVYMRGFRAVGCQARIRASLIEVDI